MNLTVRFLLILLSVWCSTFASELKKVKVYDGYKVYDIKPKNEKDLKFLKNLDSTEGDKRSLDFLSFHNNFNDVVRLMVKPEEQSFIEGLLETEKLDYKVTVDNIQQ